MKRVLGYKSISLSLLTGLVLIIFFQNCSKIQMSDIEQQLQAQQAELERIGADSDVVTAGLSDVPELKMIFVVDNSGTMKQNQFNLSQSFATMFDASSSSLNRFNSTTYLINTAQTLGVYTSDVEKNSVYEAIGAQQLPFSMATSVPKNVFDLNYRSADLNLGTIPGDNLGFSLTKSLNPLTYEVRPATVVGTTEKDGAISFSPEIKMKALSDVTTVEDEFKRRLSVMSADRFPTQKLSVNGVTEIVPQNSQIVDTESGLCSVARILRNPASYIQPGQLVSFAIVSDENDNDPGGEKCVQTVKELVGTEKLIDLDCKKNQTAVTYKPPTTIDTPDRCKLNGKAGYAFEFQYSNPDKITTNIEYYGLTAADKYTAYYYNLKYKVFDKRLYKYNFTKLVYFINECFDVFSDGNKIGVKCTPKASPEPAKYYQGAVATTCYDLAKSLDDRALNVDGAKPTCTDEVKDIAVCNEADSRCTGTDTFKDFLANGGNPIAGKVPATQADCDTQAKKDINYVSGAICTAANKTNLANCTGQSTDSLCAITTPKTYGYVAKTVGGNQAGADNCVIYVKTNYTNYADTQAATDGKAFIKTCAVINTPVANTKVASSMGFFDTNGVAYDGGNQLAVGVDCSSSQGVLDKAYALAVAKDAKVQKTDICKVTAITSAAETTVDRVLTTCDDQAAKRCVDDKLRSCTSTLIAATSTPSNGTETAFKTVPERINCDSKCGDSVTGLCDVGTDPATLVKDFLVGKYGARTICLSSTSVIESGKVSLTAQLEAQKDMLCKPNPTDNSPTYPYVTRTTYYSQEKIVDHVAGSIKNEAGAYVPKQDLMTFIKSKIAELKTNQFVFTAFVQRSGDPALPVGSKGVDYEKFISDQGGQIESVASKDYSVALKQLSSILKNSLERSFIVKKMRPDQIINKVSITRKAGGETVVLNPSSWSYTGNTLKISESFEFVEGDQFKVDFQNNVN